MTQDLDTIAEEILGYVKKERVMNGLSILNRYILKHEQGTGIQIADVLKDLVRLEKLRDLYPRNVAPADAAMSQTFYILSGND